MARVFAGVCATWLVAATALLVGCPGGAASNPECPGTAAQPLSATGATALTGATLGAKTIALTFDDGSGTRTEELSLYLKQQGIRAVFFQNGHCFTAGNPCRVDGTAAVAATVLAELEADGHLVANHTQDHYDLTTDTTHFPAGATGDSAILKELTDTDAIIAPYVTNKWFLFRAPYGSFGNRPYNVLHASLMDKYVGHVGWDIGGSYVGNDTTGYAADWYCWQNAKTTTKKCGDRYINEIKAVGKGIVLMHDADYGNVANTNQTTGVGNTVDMVKYMVPLLKGLGYTFVRADEVPAIKALLPPVPDGGADAGDAGDGAPFDAALEAADDASTSSSSSGDPLSSSSSGAVTPATVSPDPCAPQPTQPATLSAPSAHAH